MTRYFTVVWEDAQGRKIADPHVTDIKFDTLANGDACVRLKNHLGDDPTVNLNRNSIAHVNKGFFNLKGADYAYHQHLPACEATEPSRCDTVDNASSYFDN